MIITPARQCKHSDRISRGLPSMQSSSWYLWGHRTFWMRIHILLLSMHLYTTDGKQDRSTGFNSNFKSMIGIFRTKFLLWGAFLFQNLFICLFLFYLYMWLNSEKIFSTMPGPFFVFLSCFVLFVFVLFCFFKCELWGMYLEIDPFFLREVFRNTQVECCSPSGRVLLPLHH